MMEFLRGVLENAGSRPPSFAGPDVDVDAMAALFRASASLYRVQPWELVPDDTEPLSVHCEALGLRSAVISIIGQMGESYGFVAFSDIAEFDAYLDAADHILEVAAATLPRHLALNFDPRDNFDDEFIDAIERNGWEVAGPEAYPWIFVVGDKFSVRTATAAEVTRVEAIALALAKVLANKKAVRAAVEGGQPLSRTVTVNTHAGPFEVTVGIPHPGAPIELGPEAGILGDLLALTTHDDEIDHDERRALEEQLIDQFRSSPEGQGLGETFACTIIMDLLATHFGQTVATSDYRHLREALFEIVPRRVGIVASEERPMIEQLRAFYQFLEREYELPQAGRCLRELQEDAVARLEQALLDPGFFNMDESIFVAGAEAGIDLESQEGIGAGPESIPGPSQPLPDLLSGLGLPSPPTRSRAKSKKRATKKRKKSGKKKGSRKKASKKKRSR